MATERMNGANGEARWHALDAVRGGALLLGVVFHACLAFLPGPQVWIIDDASASSALSITFFVLHIFRMTVFFLIAGFFARLVLERRGVAGFIKNRATRIGVPLVVAWPFVLASIIAVIIWVAIRANGGQPPADAAPPPPLTAETFPLTHLWFLYVLLIFYAGALVLRGVARVLDRGGAVRARVLDPLVRWTIGGPLASGLLALPMFAALALNPHWLMWFGVPTPDIGLMPNTTALLCYGVAFGAGWLAHRQAEKVLARWKRDWASNIFHALVASWICVAMAGATPILAPAAQNLATSIYAGFYALAAWSWSLGLIGVAMRFLSAPNPAIRYLADASYWIYIVHLPIVLVLQAAVAPLDLTWAEKLPMILGLSFAVMFVSYDLLVRYSWLGAILNGRKVRAPNAMRAPQLAAAE